MVVMSWSVSFSGETYRPQILGGDAEFLSAAFDVFPAEGVLFGTAEIKDRSSVVIIGSKVREELFGNAAAIGEHITVKDRKSRIGGPYSARCGSHYT